MEPIVEQLGKFFLTIDKEPYSSSKAYERLTVVSDSNDIMYISITDVPAGTSLSDTDYWKPYPAGRPNLTIQPLDVTAIYGIDKYPALNEQQWFICTNSQGEISGGVVTLHDSLGQLVHESEIRAGKHVGAHLGDIIVVININNSIVAKIFTDDEARAPEDNVLIHGMLTSQDKEKIDFKFRGEQNINNMLETGFYYGTLGRPEGSEDGEAYHVSVKVATVADNNNKYSIEQLLYSIKYHNKIFVRVGFTTDKTNPNLVEWEGFQQITNWFVDKSGNNANLDVNNGFYGYVADNIPSDATQWGNLAVRRADKPDGANFTSIEQIFYGRGSDDGKIWFRLGFYNGSTYEWGKWTSNSITYDLSNIVNKGYASQNEYNEIMSLYNNKNFIISETQSETSDKLLLNKGIFQTIKNGEAIFNKAFYLDKVGYNDLNNLFSTRIYMYFGGYNTINDRYPIITVDIDYPVTLIP